MTGNSGTAGTRTRHQRRYGQVHVLLHLIKRRGLNNASFAALGIFPLAMVLDLIIGVGFERDVKNHGADNHFLLFEILHYLLFFSYALLVHLQECSEIVRKVSAFPVSNRAKVLVVTLNIFRRFPTVVLIFMSRLFFWLHFDGSTPTKLLITSAGLVAFFLVGYGGAMSCVRFGSSPWVLGVAAGAGVVIVLAVALPFWG